MKQTVTKSDFIDAFRVVDRLENFSYEARELLFDKFEEIEEDTGEEMELDVIAVCCDYNEDSPENIASNYNIDLSDVDQEDEDAVKEAVREYIEENTTVVGETAVGFVYAVF